MTNQNFTNEQKLLLEILIKLCNMHRRAEDSKLDIECVYPKNEGVLKVNRGKRIL